MLNVVFQLNSKTTDFQTYIYNKFFFLSFNVKISLLKFVPRILDTFYIYQSHHVMEDSYSGQFFVPNYCKPFPHSSMI